MPHAARPPESRSAAVTARSPLPSPGRRQRCLRQPRPREKGSGRRTIGALSAAAARAALARVLGHYVDVLLGNAEAERWARFVVREQMQPTRAFETIERFMGGAHGLATRLVAVALQRPEDEEVRLRVFTMIGQILVFRVAQALVLRRMGW